MTSTPLTPEERAALREAHTRRHSCTGKGVNCDIIRLLDRVEALEAELDAQYDAAIDAVKRAEAAEERAKVLAENLRTVLLYLDHRALPEKGHFGPCSPPATPCDGSCAAFAYEVRGIRAARNALAEGKK